MADPRWHSVEVTVGPYSWTATPGDTIATVREQYRNGGVLLDGLRIAWTSAPDHPILGQQLPWEADFGLLIPSLQDVGGIEEGTPVCIKVWNVPPGTFLAAPFDDVLRAPLALFLGRVADMEAEPHKLGNVVQVTCVDYLADLAELPVGGDDYSESDWNGRLGTLLAEAEIHDQWITGWMADSNTVNLTVDAKTASQTTALEAVTGLLADDVYNEPAYGFAGSSFPVVRKLGNVVTDTIPLDGKLYASTWLWKGLPGQLPRPGLYSGVLGGPTNAVTVVIDPAHTNDYTTAQAFHACLLPTQGLRWQHRKAAAVDRTVVRRGLNNKVTQRLKADPAQPSTSTYTHTTNLAPQLTKHRDLAAYLLPEPDETGWETEQVTILAPDPYEGGAVRFLVPPDTENGDYDRYASGDSLLAQPVVLYGLPPEQSPAGNTWYAGTLRGAAITFKGGTYTLDLQLGRRLPRSNTKGPSVFPESYPLADLAWLSWGSLDLDPTYSATTWNDVDDAVSWYDLRLVRSHLHA